MEDLPIRSPLAFVTLRPKIKAELESLYPGKSEILEKHLFNAVVRFAKKREMSQKLSSPDLLHLYADTAYGVLTRKKTYLEIVEDLKKDRIEWDAFPQFRQQREAEENSNKQEIEDGIHQCTAVYNGKQCGSWKTVSCMIQTRSADEGMTVFIRCAECKNIWKIYQ